MFDLDPTVLFVTIIFSAIGIGYFSYGKRNNGYFTMAGLGLVLYPYLTDNLWVIIGLGILLVALPFILDRFFPR